ncbi:MAG: hypothetical protein KGQ41_03930 [Alphaproteobacteria bacterium]|nr:hypothetical protein [Alphaproteobacteria bacterium]
MCEQNAITIMQNWKAAANIAHAGVLLVGLHWQAEFCDTSINRWNVWNDHTARRTRTFFDSVQGRAGILNVAHTLNDYDARKGGDRMLNAEIPEATKARIWPTQPNQAERVLYSSYDNIFEPPNDVTTELDLSRILNGTNTHTAIYTGCNIQACLENSAATSILNFENVAIVVDLVSSNGIYDGQTNTFPCKACAGSGWATLRSLYHRDAILVKADDLRAMLDSNAPFDISKIALSLEDAKTAYESAIPALPLPPHKTPSLTPA